MEYTIFDFTKAYCTKYAITEDDFTQEDVEYIDITWYQYCDWGNLPDYMTTELVLIC